MSPILPVLLYFALFGTSAWQATLGKQLLTKHVDLQRAFSKVKRPQPSSTLNRILAGEHVLSDDEPESRQRTIVTARRGEARRQTIVRDRREARSRFAGQVLAEDGRPIEGAEVLFDARDSEQDRTETTGRDGRFDVRLPRGTYDIIGSAEGLLPASIEKVAPSTDLTLQLQPDPVGSNM